jgi:hypothetical protein
VLRRQRRRAAAAGRDSKRRVQAKSRRSLT